MGMQRSLARCIFLLPSKILYEAMELTVSGYIKLSPSESCSGGRRPSLMQKLQEAKNWLSKYLRGKT